ncbi:hypothetical protein [Pollutibacter soli]|uniref:hypothetical protein n=1 Tax=Pollutibacter soli TaxID=3034157 RepID=UPI0030141803
MLCLFLPLCSLGQELTHQKVVTLLPTNDHHWLNIGTGIVLRNNSDYYLVTALHVVAKTPKKFEKYWPKSTIDHSYKYLHFGSEYPKIKSSFFINLVDSMTGEANYRTFSLSDKLLDIAIIKLDESDSAMHFMFSKAIEITDIDTSTELCPDQYLQVIGSSPYKTRQCNYYAMNPRNDRENPAIFKFDFEKTEIDLAGSSGGIVYRKDDFEKQTPIGILVAAADDGSFGLGIHLRFVHNLIRNWD